MGRAREITYDAVASSKERPGQGPTPGSALTRPARTPTARPPTSTSSIWSTRGTLWPSISLSPGPGLSAWTTRSCQRGCPAGQYGPRLDPQHPHGICGSSYTKDDSHKPSRLQEKQSFGQLNRAELSFFSLFFNGFIFILFWRSIPEILTDYHA